MPEIKKLVQGYKDFYQEYFVENNEVYQKLARDGQAPKIAMIACSDSRVDPATITKAPPGELFVIRNVANLVPPYQPDTATYHGTSAALEFAINNLRVKSVIVFGHSKCAGIRALVDNKQNDDFVNSWMSIASEVRQKIKHEHASLDINEQAHLCEKLAIEKSIGNLHSFPWINQKIKSNTLRVIGWYFDIDEGRLFQFIESSKIWEQIS